MNKKLLTYIIVNIIVIIIGIFIIITFVPKSNPKENKNIIKPEIEQIQKELADYVYYKYGVESKTALLNIEPVYGCDFWIDTCLKQSKIDNAYKYTFKCMAENGIDFKIEYTYFYSTDSNKVSSNIEDNYDSYSLIVNIQQLIKEKYDTFDVRYYKKDDDNYIRIQNIVVRIYSKELNSNTINNLYKKVLAYDKKIKFVITNNKDTYDEMIKSFDRMVTKSETNYSDELFVSELKYEVLKNDKDKTNFLKSLPKKYDKKYNYVISISNDYVNNKYVIFKKKHD